MANVDMNLLDPAQVNRRKIINQDITAAFAKNTIKELAREEPKDQDRLYHLATTFWKEDDLKDYLLILRVQNFLDWSVLQEEFANFALDWLSDKYNDSLPHYADFEDILGREIKERRSDLVIAGYAYKRDKVSIEDHYVQCVLRILMKMCLVTDDSQGRRVFTAPSCVTAWLGAEATLGDKVWVVYHSVMLLHLEECRRMYADSSYREKAKIRWKNSRCKKHLTRILQGRKT